MSLRPVMQKVLAKAQYELGNYKQLTKEIQMENQNSNEEKLPELRANVYDAIGTERYYQEQKWGSIEEHPQSVGGYLTLMRVHLTDAEAAWADQIPTRTRFIACVKCLPLALLAENNTDFLSAILITTRSSQNAT